MTDETTPLLLQHLAAIRADIAEITAATTRTNDTLVDLTQRLAELVEVLRERADPHGT